MKKWVLLLILSLLPTTTSLAKELAVPEAPAGIKTHWVARYMEFNDIPMSIQSFKTPEGLRTLLPRLEEYLQTFGEDVQITRNRKGETILATADDNAFYSIQLHKELTQIQGVFTISSKHPVRDYTSSNLPLGFIRIEKQAFFDGPYIQEFTVLGTSASESEALAVVERMMRKQGWITTRNYRSTRYFSRRGEHAQATVQPAEKGVGSLILISKELSK